MVSPVMNMKKDGAVIARWTVLIAPPIFILSPSTSPTLVNPGTDDVLSDTLLLSGCFPRGMLCLVPLLSDRDTDKALQIMYGYPSPRTYLNYLCDSPQSSPRFLILERRLPLTTLFLFARWAMVIQHKDPSAGACYHYSRFIPITYTDTSTRQTI